MCFFLHKKSQSLLYSSFTLTTAGVTSKGSCCHSEDCLGLIVFGVYFSPGRKIKELTTFHESGGK